MKRIQYLILLFLFSLSAAVSAQNIPIPGVPSKEEVRNELAKRNIDETELKRRLLAKGIDVDNASPEELIRLQSQIEQVVSEMEGEQRQAEQAAREAAAKSAEEIQDAVEDGASVEEAITEVTSEEASSDLPLSRIYGHNLFRNKSLQVFRTTENATPPDSYPLKSGDEIAVSIFGASQVDFIVLIDKTGFLSLPNGIRIPMAGVPLGEARQLLLRRLQQFYSFGEGQYNIRIQVARTITVNIFGEVENNGSYSISALNTGFNALVAAGGATDLGSVRNIQLIQGDEKVILDVYDFLSSPVQRTEFFLKNNATIYVPIAGKVVSIAGGVRRPMRYELKEGENLSELIDFAGGELPRAESSSISILRYVDGVDKIINVDLAENPDFVLENGDKISVPIIANPIQDFVEIQGAVLLPGRYAYREGITVEDLFSIGRLRPGGREDVAFLFRTNEDGTNKLIRLSLADENTKRLPLQRGDRIQILFQSSFTDQSTFTIEGAVRNGGATLPYPQDGALTLEEALLLAGGITNNATSDAILIRTPQNNTEEKEYVRINITAAASINLLPFDRVIVYSQERFNDPATITIGGAVRESGTYTYDPSLKLNDLLFLAGGTRNDAQRDRVEIFRLQIENGEKTTTLLRTIDLDNADDFVLQPFDQVYVRSAAEYEPIESVDLLGEVRYPGRYALIKDNERLSDIIRRAGGLTSEAFPQGATLLRSDKDQGYVVLDLDKVVVDQSIPANIVLRQGDAISIPKKNELVTIYTEGTLANRFGVDSISTGNRIKVAYQGDHSAAWYINRYAGGFENAIAKKRETTVEFANGQVKETNSFLGIRNYPKVEPGGSIRVALKAPKQRRQRREERFDWIGLAQVLVGAATTITTFILIRQ